MTNNNNSNFNVCNSQMKTTEDTLIWTIDKFSIRNQETGDCLISEIFTSSSPSGNPLKWRLHIYPNGDREEAKDHVSIYIHLVESVAKEVSAKTEYSIRDSDGYDHTVIVGGNEYEIYIKNGHSWGYRKFVERDVLFDEKNGLLPADRLTIVCQLTVYEEAVRCDKFDDIEVPLCQALENMGKLFEKSSQYADAMLVISDEKQFKVYKGILACQSPVFAAMFEDGMFEANKGIVIIEDIKAEVIEQMLRFIYSGMAPKLGEMAKELMIAADKYQLDRLKVLCERHLANSLGNGNACEFLVLADRHSAKHLKAKAIKYMKLNINEVMKSEGWKMLAKGNDAELMEQIVKAIAEGK